MTQPTPITQLHPATFEDWWKMQFHKTGRVICQVKWDAITSPEGYSTRMMDKSTGQFINARLKATPEEIIAGQKRSNSAFFDAHGLTENKEQKNFVRRPPQWLNQGGWMDE